MALDIKINEDYRITSDSRNIIVNRRFIVDPTKAPKWKEREAQGASAELKEEWREVTFFHDVEQALKWIVQQQIRDSYAETLNDLLREIRRFNRQISEVIR